MSGYLVSTMADWEKDLETLKASSPPRTNPGNWEKDFEMFKSSSPEVADLMQGLNEECKNEGVRIDKLKEELKSNPPGGK